MQRIPKPRRCWKQDGLTEIIPEGLNFSDSDSMAIGGLVVRNDVRSFADATLTNATLTSDSLGIYATEDMIVKATADSTAESSGGSAFGSGQSLAVNAVIATNLILSQADAHISDSDIQTTSGDVFVYARNTSIIDAKTLSSTTSGDQGVSGTIAFNTIGWDAQNILFSTLDTLLGTDALGNADPSDVKAYILDSNITASGNISVVAESLAHIDATISNKTESIAYALMNASSMAIGAVLVSNMVNSSAYAYIDSATQANITSQTGDITIDASDEATILANSEISSISQTSSDGGFSLINQAVQDIVGTDFTDRSGIQELQFGDGVTIDDFDYTSNEEPAMLEKGNRVRLEFAIGGGAKGDVYEYIGDQPIENADLDGENYTDTSKWKQITAETGETYKFIGVAEFDADVSNEIETETIDLSTEDFTDSSRWAASSLINPEELIPGWSMNLTDSDSTAFGGLVVRNDVRSHVQSYINQANVSASGNIHIQALELASIRAQDISTVTSSGGSMFGKGDSNAVGAVIANNLMISKSNAYATNSTLTTTSGDITILAENESTMIATITSHIESGGNAVGVVLAFNTVGWESQNILFNAIDIIFDTSIGDDDASQVKAYTQNSSINAAGSITIDATMDATFTALIENAATTLSTSLGDSETMSIAPIISMNKLATDVESAIINADTLKTGNGDLTVTSKDTSDMDVKVAASSVAVSAGVKASKAISVGLSIANNEIKNDVSAFIKHAGSPNNKATVNGNLVVTASKDATINAAASASAIALAAGAQGGSSVAGGGTLAFNKIMGIDNVSIENSAFTVNGDVKLLSSNTSVIDASLLSTAIAVAVSGKSSPAFAIGLSVARNIIGWDGSQTEVTYSSDENPETLKAGDTVRVVDNPLLGDVYEYIGPDLGAEDAINLETQNYGDRDAWQQVNLKGKASEIHAVVKETDLNTTGVVTIDAISESKIDASVLAGAAAVAASAKGGPSVSAAGVYAENKIKTDVRAYIDGDQSSGITASSIAILADDRSSIQALAGAASVAANISGKTSVAVSIGMSLAFNEINNTVFAYIANVDHAVKTTTGDLDISAMSRGRHLFDLDIADVGLTFDDLDNAGQSETDHPETTDMNEAALDQENDTLILDTLVNAFANGGEILSDMDTLTSGWQYTTSDGEQTLLFGDTIKLEDDYRYGGAPGKVYTFIGNDNTDLDLSTIDFSDTDNWQLVKPDIRISKLDDGNSWMLVASDGTSYTLVKKDDGMLDVSKVNINAISAAASLAAGIGGQTGVAVSGGGAVAINNIISNVESYVDHANMTSVQDVNLDASSSSNINSTVVAVSMAVGVGGQNGIGVSLGIAVARNFIGFESDGDESRASVKAFVNDSSITASGKLSQNAVANQNINALVFAGSAAVAGGGQSGIAVSGSGVWSENRIAVDIESSITGTSGTIEADDIALNAKDMSSINAFAGAASVAASFAGNAGVSVSIGVSMAKNTIDNAVVAKIVGNDVISQNNIVVNADAISTIDAISAAASVAAGFGGTAGVAVSGAGAEAKNVITTGTTAYAKDGTLNAQNDLSITAINQGAINAKILAVSVAASGGGTAGVGASIGVAFARNIIGYGYAHTSYDYSTNNAPPERIQTGDRIKIEKGVRAGDVYEYLGSDPLSNLNEQADFLLVQDYGDNSLWKNVSLSENRAPVKAYVQNAAITAGNTITIDAKSQQTIDAIVLSASVAISGGGTAGVGVSGAGAGVKNVIAMDIASFIKGSDNIAAKELVVQAEDRSSISAIVGAASVAASFGGTAGVSVSIGLSIAFNQIDTDTNAFIESVETMNIGTGGISITAKSLADDLFTFGGISSDLLDDAPSTTITITHRRQL